MGPAGTRRVEAGSGKFPALFPVHRGLWFTWQHLDTHHSLTGLYVLKQPPVWPIYKANVYLKSLTRCTERHACSVTGINCVNLWRRAVRDACIASAELFLLFQRSRHSQRFADKCYCECSFQVHVVVLCLFLGNVVRCCFPNLIIIIILLSDYFLWYSYCLLTQLNIPYATWRLQKLDRRSNSHKEGRGLAKGSIATECVCIGLGDYFETGLLSRQKHKNYIPKCATIHIKIPKIVV